MRCAGRFALGFRRAGNLRTTSLGLSVTTRSGPAGSTTLRWLRAHRVITAGGPGKAGARIDVGRSTAGSAAPDTGEGSTVVSVQLVARARAQRVEMDRGDRLGNFHGSARLHREGDAAANIGSAAREKTQSRQQPMDQNSKPETHPIALGLVRGRGAARSSGPAWMG